MGAGLGTKRDQTEMAGFEGGVGSGIREGGVSWKGMGFRKGMRLSEEAGAWKTGTGTKKEGYQVLRVRKDRPAEQAV